MSATELSAELHRWIERASGGAVELAERRPGGARREAWNIDVRMPDGTLAELFLRYDRSVAPPHDPYTLHREAGVFRALQSTEVPVPRVIDVHPTEQAILSERVPGATWFSHIEDPDRQLAVASDFITKLAALHRLDPKGMDLPGIGPVSTVPDHVRREIEVWRGLYRNESDRPDPRVELGLRWLEANIPAYEEPVVLVQGDTGPGNFLYEGDRVTAVLDWELSHLGDPMDDLGWMALRSVQEPFTHFPDRLHQYAQLSPHPVDLDRLRYYRVFAELRVVIIGATRRARQDLLSEVGNGIIYGALHERLLVEAIAEALGVELVEPELPVAEVRAHGWLYDAALAQIREVILPRVEDPFAVLRTKGLARVLKHLQAIDRDAAAYDAQELDELELLLGTRPDSLEAGRTELALAIRREEVDDDKAVEHLWRRSRRSTELARGAMGALADRHFAPLT